MQLQISWKDCSNLILTLVNLAILCRYGGLSIIMNDFFYLTLNVSECVCTFGVCCVGHILVWGGR